MWNDKPEDFTPNDAGGISLVISSPLLDAALVVDGLDKVTAQPDDAGFTLSKVASGLTNVNNIRTTSGKLMFDVSNASTSMGTLSTLVAAKAQCSFAFTDPVSPELNCSSGYCFFEKHPDVVRSAETNVSTFTFICPILKVKTGGFSIVVAE
jgi:hypothetical protein